jgi:hydrophobic/amphiphilic exporter-1 (mainly G- bacteria), HAE1 family
MSPKRSLISRIIAKPITVLMLFLSLIGMGVIAYMRIPVNLLPEGFQSSSVTIWIPAFDTSPLENEDKITRPVEEIIRSIPGIKQISSRSGDSGSRIYIEFSPKTDIDMAYMEVKDRIERIKHNFPDKVDRYFCFRFNLDTDLPIFMMAVTYDDEVARPFQLAEDIIKARIEGVDGVANVGMDGLVDEAVRIFLDPGKVEGHKVNLYDLITRMSTDNFTRPAGRILDSDRRYNLRVDSHYQTLVEVEEFPVSRDLELKDIGEVVLGRSYRDFVMRVNGKPGLFVGISKESQKNTVEVCRAVEAELARLEADPRLEGFEFLVYMNQREIIESSLNVLKTSMAWGGLFALIILYLFLRHKRATFIVALSIPTSILMALVVVFFSGNTINILSLAGFTLAVGMLVDNAIVVTENIFRRKSSGLSAADASARGATEVGTAILMATCTTIVVFLPLIFFQEDQGLRLVLAEIGLPISFSLIASLFSALAFIPLATTYLIWRDKRKKTVAPAFLKSYHSQGPVARFYEKGTRWIQSHRFAAVIIAFAVVALIDPVGKKVDRTLEEGGGGHGIEVSVDLPRHYTIDEANTVFRKLEDFTRTKLDEYQLDAYLSIFERDGGRLLYFHKDGTDPRLIRDLPKKLLGALPRLPGVSYDMRIEGADNSRKEFRVEISGPDSRLLADIAFDLKQRLRQIPEFTNVRTDIEEGRDEVRIEVDRDLAARFGVDPQVLRGTVAWGLGGQRLPDYIVNGDEYRMQIEYEEALVESLELIRNMEITSNQGARLPLASLANLTVTKGPAVIRRQNGNTTMGITATPLTDNVYTLSRKISETMRDFDFPRGYSWTEKGGIAEFEEKATEIMLAFLMSLALVFILMGILFESFILPFTVILSVPFSILGGLVLLLVTGVPLDVNGMVGFILLAGIVVNNAIVLVDHINRLRRLEGLSRKDAVIRGGRERLRPILMTAMTTIFGLLPMAIPDVFATSEAGSVFSYRSLAIVVLGGLAFSTLFTVLFIPLFYTLLDDLWNALKRTFVKVLATTPAEDTVA